MMEATHHKSRNRPWIVWLALITLSLAGAWIIMYATHWGAISFSDSVVYILSARSLLEGRGLGIPGPGGAFQPLQLHPPLYPIVLAGIGLLGIDPLEGARLLAVSSFALLVLLVGIVFYRQSRQALPAILVSAALVVSPVFLAIFSMAMSEGLFYLTGLLALSLVLNHLERPRRAMLVLAGVLGGLSFLARYTGVTWVAAGCLALLVLRKVGWKQRWIECFWLALPAVALSAVWLIPLSLSTRSLASRTFQFSLDLGGELEVTKTTLIDMGWRWVPFSEILLPTRSYALRAGLMLGGLALLGLLATLAVWRLGRRGDVADNGQPGEVTGNMAASHLAKDGLFNLAGILALFAGTYLVMVVFSFYFSVPRNDLNERLLSPLYLAGMCISVALLSWMVFGLRGFPARLVAGFALLLPLLLIMDGARRSLPIVSDLHKNGDGYTSFTWRDSETILLLPRVAPDLELISNQSEAILFLTGRPAYNLAEFFSAQPQEPFTRYGDGASGPAGVAEQLFRQRKAALVIFPKTFFWQLYPFYEERTQERIDALFAGLDVKGPFHDGAVYFYQAR